MDGLVAVCMFIPCKDLGSDCVHVNRGLVQNYCNYLILYNKLQ